MTYDLVKVFSVNIFQLLQEVNRADTDEFVVTCLFNCTVMTVVDVGFNQAIAVRTKG